MGARELVVLTLVLAGGEITGRIRLQKVIYLLCQRGLKSDLKFSYHHYGPFSRGIDEGISSAKVCHGLREAIFRRAADGVPFSVFTLDNDLSCGVRKLDGISLKDAEHLVQEVIKVPSTTVEIAATIHWLRYKEGMLSWHGELARRKGPKLSHGRVDKALDLLSEIGFHEIRKEANFLMVQS